LRGRFGPPPRPNLEEGPPYMVVELPFGVRHDDDEIETYITFLFFLYIYRNLFFFWSYIYIETYITLS
jgi:hypothetical protein